MYNIIVGKYAAEGIYGSMVPSIIALILESYTLTGITIEWEYIISGDKVGGSTFQIKTSATQGHGFYDITNGFLHLNGLDNDQVVQQVNIWCHADKTKLD